MDNIVRRSRSDSPQRDRPSRPPSYGDLENKLRHSSKGLDLRKEREGREKRVRSDSSLREAGEILQEDRTRETKRHRQDDRPERLKSGRDGGRPAVRGDLSPGRKERGPTSREDRRTPNKRSPDLRPSSASSSLLSNIPADIRKAALEAQKREQARLAAAAAAAEKIDLAANESLSAVGNGKSKHSPIVWNEASRGISAAELALKELEQFQRMNEAQLLEQSSLTGNGAPAMKASPSVSGSQDADAGPEQPQQVLKSKWLIEDEQGEQTVRQTNGKLKKPVCNQGAVHIAEDPDLAALNQQELQELPTVGEGQLLDDQGSDGEKSLSEFEATRRKVDMLNSCRKVDSYERLNRISEGTYGVVFRAKDKESGTICALKKIKMEKERDGFPLTSIREINILLSFHHKNIVNVSEVVVGEKNLDQVYMVMEFMEHDLKGLMEEMSEPFTVAEPDVQVDQEMCCLQTKNLMKQLLEGIAYLHGNWVLHRDLKTSNILYNQRGEVKICDFGLARQYGSPLRPYTLNVVTLYYRSIELLLGCQKYSTAIDVWSLGCIMAELLTKKVLFQGTSELDQIDKIFKILGTPTDKTWPGMKDLSDVQKIKLNRYKGSKLRELLPQAFSSFDANSGLTAAGFDLIDKMLTCDPSQRVSAKEALNHPWFREHPHPKDNEMMPTFPPKGAARQRLSRAASPGPNGPIFASRANELSLLFGKK